MNKTVWIFQYKKDVEQKGEANASWYVGWYDLAGKRHSESCGPGARGKNKAEKRQRRLQSELDTGIHQPESRKSWAEFRADYEVKILTSKATDTRQVVKESLNHFERIVKPRRMEAIKTQTIDSFIAERRQEHGKKPGSVISPATVNKDLRHIKAALRVAQEWNYLAKVPKFRMLREPGKIPRFVTPEHFAVLYHQACPLASLPEKCESHYAPKEWWQALVVTAYMTGFRINEILSLRKEDVDFDAGQLIFRWEDTKGKREELIPLHAVVIQHLRNLVGTYPLIFRWGHDERTLWVEFERIQREAGIQLVCRGNHEHTPACHVYGFHDLRRAFATVNAPRMKPETLQKLMRHKSYLTTLRYINLTSQVQDAVNGMPVPEALRPNDPQKPKEDNEEEKPKEDNEEEKPKDDTPGTPEDRE